MATLSFLIFMTCLVFLLFGCEKSAVCNSGLRMINADWLDEGEKFKLISRWGA
jgi:hypothetical protein